MSKLKTAGGYVWKYAELNIKQTSRKRLIQRINELTDELNKEKEKNKKLIENYDELLIKYEMKKLLFVRKDHKTKELMTELYIRKDTLNSDYISKDKIKEKIKQLEKEQEQNRKEFSRGIDFLSNKIEINYSIREYLQELLEESEENNYEI